MLCFQPRFTLSQPAVRVRFGPGVRRETGVEIERLGCARAAILSTPGKSGMAEELASDIGRLAAGITPMAQMHTPVSATEEALREIERTGADCLVAIGGGSTIGLGKALALRTGLPQIVLPTTYAGSEATPVLGQTEGGQKITITDPRVQPRVVLYDAELVCSLPATVTVASAFNGMAHAVEGLYARDRNPISTLFAIEGLRAFRVALPAVRKDPQDLQARGETLFGAWLCGTVLGQVGMALHHKLCHVLGGSFDLPHAETHSVMLPYTVAYNAGAAGLLLDPAREIFETDDIGRALAAFASEMGAPRSLSALGMKEDDLESAADIAMEAQYWNPRPLMHDEILRLLRSAWAGDLPTENARI
jgi:maleylacetate reductase